MKIVVMQMVPVMGFIIQKLEASTSLTTLGTVFNQIVQWVISFLGMISEEPLLLVGLAVVVVGLIMGIAFKAIRGKGRRGS